MEPEREYIGLILNVTMISCTRSAHALSASRHDRDEVTPIELIFKPETKLAGRQK